jgi:uncharacterized protein with NRDE domain
MCVVALAWAAHPRWTLVMAGNRDEFHARPSSPLSRWDGHHHVIAGKDLQSGGSWLGVSEAGRFAVITNVRQGAGPAPELLSRGALVADFLKGETLDAESLGAYNPFNLAVIDPAGARFLSNRPTPHCVPLGPGVHGLSNGTQDEVWRRKTDLMAALSAWLAGPADDPAGLFAALGEEDSVSGEPPIFIRAPVYGTRCSTVVAIDKQGGSIIIERRFGRDGEARGESALAFRWPGQATI